MNNYRHLERSVNDRMWNTKWWSGCPEHGQQAYPSGSCHECAMLMPETPQHSKEQRVVMAPAHIEKYPAGWSTERAINIIEMQNTARYADAADKILIRAQLYLLKYGATEGLEMAFDYLTEIRFQVEEARHMS